jgi:hypothetical protein
VPRVSGIDLRPRPHVRGAPGGRVPEVRGHRQGRNEESGVTWPCSLEQYLEYFEADQILVITSEELRAARGATMCTVFEFLGVDLRSPPERSRMCSTQRSRDAETRGLAMPSPRAPRRDASSSGS